MNFIIYLISINIIAFLLCLIDKRKAIKGKYRIREGTLLFFSLIGGVFGMVISMYLFHHKTRKLKFKLVYLFSLVWILIVIYYFYLF